MEIHEYQSKELLSRFGVTIAAGGLAYSPEQATYRAREIGGDRWMVKAQVHAGGRGKAGAIRPCATDQEIEQAAEDLLGSRVVTPQTDAGGKPVYRLYVEEALDVEREIYLALVLDRRTERVMIVASAVGGMEIEDISRQHPESVVRVIVEPAMGIQAFQAREIWMGLGLDARHMAAITHTVLGCYRAFRDMDATMVEINPLALTTDGRLVALDAKMSFDDNALYRRPEISELRDKSQEDPRETYARDRGLNYVGLDGEIGCIINGAGLAMATMDMIELAGGRAANFLDVGGGASPERIVKAFKSVLGNDRVETVLINIFAGINRCDWVAKGIVMAVEQLAPRVPLVVRLAGTNVEAGQRILRECHAPLIVASTLAEAASAAVDARRGLAAIA